MALRGMMPSGLPWTAYWPAQANVGVRPDVPVLPKPPTIVTLPPPPGDDEPIADAPKAVEPEPPVAPRPAPISLVNPPAPPVAQVLPPVPVAPVKLVPPPAQPVVNDAPVTSPPRLPDMIVTTRIDDWFATIYGPTLPVNAEGPAVVPASAGPDAPAVVIDPSQVKVVANAPPAPIAAVASGSAPAGTASASSPARSALITTAMEDTQRPLLGRLRGGLVIDAVISALTGGVWNGIWDSVGSWPDATPKKSSGPFRLSDAYAMRLSQVAADLVGRRCATTLSTPEPGAPIGPEWVRILCDRTSGFTYCLLVVADINRQLGGRWSMRTFPDLPKQPAADVVRANRALKNSACDPVAALIYGWLVAGADAFNSIADGRVPLSRLSAPGGT